MVVVCRVEKLYGIALELARTMAQQLTPGEDDQTPCLTEPSVSLFTQLLHMPFIHSLTTQVNSNIPLPHT